MADEGVSTRASTAVAVCEPVDSAPDNTVPDNTVRTAWATPCCVTSAPKAVAPASLHCCSATSRDAKPQSASKVSSAITISGLARSSAYTRCLASSGIPAAFSRANPRVAWAVDGCVCSDSGCAAASNFTMNGKSPTSSDKYVGAGRCKLSSMCAGPRGWVPYQISAHGRPSAVISNISGSANRSPHA